ncbi:hypothetical protein [Peribacillus sp. SCS-155]
MMNFCNIEIDAIDGIHCLEVFLQSGEYLESLSHLVGHSILNKQI